MIVCVTIKAEDVAAAEKLVDWMFQLNDRQQMESILLVFGSDVHEEFQTKIRLSAGVAFRNVDLITRDPANLFNAAAEYISNAYKSPWIYLDGYCVPLKKAWLDELQLEYMRQPKRIMGPHLKNPTKTWLSPHSIYPADFGRMPQRDWTEFSTKIQTIQLGRFTDMSEVRGNAVLFCSDRSGKLLEQLEETNFKECQLKSATQ
jgi:hypothetical protein